jgi:hypothetical protein
MFFGIMKNEVTSAPVEALREALTDEFGDDIRFSQGVLLVACSLEFAANPMRTRIVYAKDPDGEFDAMVKEAVERIMFEVKSSETDLSDYEFSLSCLPCEEADSLSIGFVLWVNGCCK